MADTEMRSIAVRNPRTGDTEFTFAAASAEEIAHKAARLRRNQKVWAARPITERIAIMRRWVAELIAHAQQIGAADGADTGGCHTSQFTAFIAVANINGWCEDAAGVLTRAHADGEHSLTARALSAGGRHQSVECADDAVAAGCGAGPVRRFGGAAEAERSDAPLRDTAHAHREPRARTGRGVRRRAR